MDCEDFLKGYSDWLDGLETSQDHRRFELHLQRCRACARYDRVVKQGTHLFRELPRPDASPDFIPRLRHRLYHIDDHAVLGARPGGSAALVAVAAVGLLAIVWLPFASRIPVEVELAPVSVSAPTPATEVPSLFSNGPFVTPVVYQRAVLYQGAVLYQKAVLYQGASVPSVETAIWLPRDERFDAMLLQRGLSSREGDSRR